MARLATIAFAFALAWTGIALAQAPVPLAMSERADPAIWQGEAVGGPIVHRASNVSLPAEIAGFSRFRVGAVRPDDVAANYRLKSGESETIATIFLFRPGSLPEHRIKGSLLAFASASPTAFMWANGPLEIPAPSPLFGYKGVFKTGIGPDTVMDYLYFLELGKWTVKVRATINGVKSPSQEKAIDDFVRALPWSEILAANGACSGPACAPLPAAIPFDSHYMELMLGRLLFGRTNFDRKAERALPVAYQVSLPLGGTADIHRSETEPLVYVTEVKGLTTYRLMRLPDPVEKFPKEGFGMLSVGKPIYGLVIGSGDQLLMPRLFSGRPSPEMFSATVGELILNPTANPFVTVKETAEAMPN